MMISPLMACREFYRKVYRVQFLVAVAIIVLLPLFLPPPSHAQLANKRITFHNNKLSIEPAKGWKKIERPNTLMAYASAHETSSIFFTIAQNEGASTMEDVLAGAITNFETAFKVLKVGEFKTGKIKGTTKDWRAVFTTLELEWEGKPKNLPFRFYLTMFDAGKTLYLIQGSTQVPVNKEREKEIFVMIRSVIAKP